MSKRLEKCSEEKNTNRELIHTLTVFFALAANSALAESPTTSPKKPLTAGVSELYRANREKIERIMEDFDNPRNAMRQQAMKTVVDECRDVMLQMNPLPSEIDSLFPDPERIAPKKRKGVSLEKTMRLARTGNVVRETSMALPDTILAREYAFDECIQMIESQTGFQIQISPEIDNKIFAMRLTVEAGKNDCPHVLEKIQDIAGVDIRFDVDPKILRIVPQKKAKQRIISTGKFIGLESEATNDDIANVELRMSPRSGALVSLWNVKSNPTMSVSLGASSIPQWITCLQSQIPKRLDYGFPASEDSSLLRVTCGVARFPETIHLERNERKKIGFQNIRISLDHDDPTIVIVEASAFPLVEWAATSSSIDKQMYGSVDANQYRFFDEAGKELSAKAVCCRAQERTLYIMMQCDGRMNSGEVTAYTQLSCDEEIIIPMAK